MSMTAGNDGDAYKRRLNALDVDCLKGSKGAFSGDLPQTL